MGIRIITVSRQFGSGGRTIAKQTPSRRRYAPLPVGMVTAPRRAPASFAAIARALLKNAPVLILDEATSALDIDTEERVLKNIMKKEKGRTCVVTTHRPSVLSVSDHIYEIRESHLKKLK